jgi:hypothetical protein
VARNTVVGMQKNQMNRRIAMSLLKDCCQRKSRTKSNLATENDVDLEQMLIWKVTRDHLWGAKYQFTVNSPDQRG